MAVVGAIRANRGNPSGRRVVFGKSTVHIAAIQREGQAGQHRRARPPPNSLGSSLSTLASVLPVEQINKRNIAHRAK
jgi:hypothetical protein